MRNSVEWKREELYEEEEFELLPRLKSLALPGCTCYEKRTNLVSTLISTRNLCSLLPKNIFLVTDLFRGGGGGGGGGFLITHFLLKIIFYYPHFYCLLNS